MTEKKNKKTVKHVIFSFAAVMLSLLIFLAVTVYAEFIGHGSKKGVLISNQYFFSSNILTSISAPEDAADNTSLCTMQSSGESSQNIQVRNYDYTGHYDNYDVSYRVYYWLDGEKVADDEFTYWIDFGNGQVEITSAVQTQSDEYTITNISKPNSTNFSVGFTNYDDECDPADALGICVAVVPTQPQYMSGLCLGTTVQLTNMQTEFDVASGFEFEDTASINEYAGFMFRISTSGVKELERNVSVVVSWDAAKLKFDPDNTLVTSDYSQGTAVTQDDVLVERWDSITIDNIDTNALYNIAFYRADESSEYWSTVTSIAQVRNLVTVTRVDS